MRDCPDGTFAGIVGFMLLHVLGARYIYSYVPYDDWSGRLFGVSLSQLFDLRRNHYDRLVHFAFGLLAPIVRMGPDHGDIWDAHKDMSFAAIGSMVWYLWSLASSAR